MIWLFVFLIVGGVSIYIEYFAQHKYYHTMMEFLPNLDRYLSEGIKRPYFQSFTDSNRRLMIWAVISSSSVIVYWRLVKEIKIKWLLWSTFVAVIIFAYGFIAIKDSFYGSGIIMLPINLWLMIGCFSVMLWGMRAAGSMLYRRVYRHLADTLDRAITALILGFVAAMLVSFVLVLTTLLYQLVVAAVFAGCIYLIYQEKIFFRTLGRNITTLAHKHLGFSTRQKSLTTIILGLTIMYLMYGLMLAYIPYPTAWDANHAYMFIPKVWSEHHGYLRNSIGSQFGPSPWLTYVAFWFQWGNLLQSGWLWIAPDTWGVVMNYFSVVIVMLMVRGLISRVIRWARLTYGTWLYQMGWLILLSWMTSGMGAFLVFVDNKSDFGVLALTLCALVLVFDRLPSLYYNQGDQSTQEELPATLYPILTTILSWVIAWVAVLAKPTSLFDLATIIILFIGIVAWAWATIGSWLLVIGLMAILKITTVPLYVSTQAGAIVVAIGLGLMVIGFVTHRKYNLTVWKKLIIRWASLLAVLIIIKTPMMLWRSTSIGTEIGWVKWYIQSVLMWYNQTESWKQKAQDTTINRQLTYPSTLLAQNSTTPTPQSCTLQSEWITQESLYVGTRKAVTEWAGEDLGRYIGYGSKTFNGTIWWFLVPIDTCIGFDADARIICQNRIDVSQGTFDILADQLNGDALLLFEQATAQQALWISTSFIQKNLARQLTLYRQDKVIVKDDVNGTMVVSVPYRWIVPLNMTQNRSLQNLSSYYTDIGVVRLVLLVILFSATVWLLIYRPRQAILPLATLMAWIIWWVSGSSIMWYGIGLVIWTMVSMLIIVDTWNDRDTIDRRSRMQVSWIMMLVWLIVSIQLLLNFIRIGSQWGGWTFVQYKTANGQIAYINDQLQQVPKEKIGLSAQDIFQMQFPHYTKTIAAIDANPDSKEAILVAGTYLTYFLRNQYNIIGDGFLNNMREWFSDENVCRGYLRLKDKDLTYLVIDPNIASVVMGDGNSTLRDRLFAKIDPTTQKITQEWGMSMLARLMMAGHIELFSTNNIGAKYAYTLSDQELITLYGVKQDDLPLLRTKIATARFRWEEGNVLLQKVLQVMAQRMSIPEQGISDLADIFGKDIDPNKLAQLAPKLQTPEWAAQVAGLSQDERLILINYLSVMQLAQTNKLQYEQTITSLLQQSIGGGSQLIVFKVK